MTELPLAIGDILARSQQLCQGSATPSLDLRLLLAAVQQCSQAQLLAYPERHLSSTQWQHLQALLERRRRGEPMAYILGRQGFWTLELDVDSSTLIPRPETERLVELALELGPSSEARVVDLGTGSGAIALALASERPRWRLVALERQESSAALAERNRKRLQLDNVGVVVGHWLSPLGRGLDLVLGNPPYVEAGDAHLSQGDLRYEPASALVAGDRGWADLAVISQQAPAHLVAGGWLMLEHGWQQGSGVRGLLCQAGLEDVATHRDLGGQERITLGRKPCE